MAEHALYQGQLWHRRLQPVIHELSYPLWMLWLDLSDPGSAVQGSRWWGRRWHPVTVRQADYGPPGEGSLDTRIRERVVELGGHWTGRIFLLCQPRMLGLLFNPLVLYWHFPPGSSVPDEVLAEVHNTPWNQRHWYRLVPDQQGDQWTVEHDKAFHVSPFMPMDQQYRWQLAFHHESLSVSIANLERSQTVFVAGLRMQREALTPARQRRLAWRGSGQAWQVLAAIYAHAFRLWRKGVRFYTHPDRHAGSE